MIFTRADVGKKVCSQMQEIDGKMQCVQVDIELTDADKDVVIAEWNANSLETVRKNSIEAVEKLRDTRMDAVSPGWNIEAYKLYKLMENRFVPGTENPKQVRIAAIFEYAKTRLAWAKTATLTELQAYDPNTDVNFPT